MAQALAKTRPGRWRTINEVTYSDDKGVVVHTDALRLTRAAVAELAER